MKSFFKSLFRIFGLVTFALASFILLLVFFSLFFSGVGIGLGAGLARGGLADISTVEEDGYVYVSGDEDSDNKLLELPVDGIILGSSADNNSAMDWLGVTYGYDLKDILAEAAEQEEIKGVLLHMQTPGGTIFGSRAIFDGVEAYQAATNKPVIAYIEGLSASGGVMAMVGADEIYADHGSMIGSIGVIGGALMYFDKPVATEGGLLGGGIETTGGIEQTVIVAGRGKDFGNPFRRPTEEEIQTLQQGVDNEYADFVSHVAANREMDETVIREQMGALIFDNKQAESYGLIDGTLNREDTIAKLAELAKVGDDYQLVRPHDETDSFWWSLLSLFSTESTVAKSRRHLGQDICDTALRLPLVYHGDPLKLCTAILRN